MAVVILSGLLSSTVLNMFVVPALYRRFGELARAPRRPHGSAPAEEVGA
jgi:Cu/Ag efflux pump CusA